jgi:predicted ATP-dependent protease
MLEILYGGVVTKSDLVPLLDRIAELERALKLLSSGATAAIKLCADVNAANGKLTLQLAELGRLLLELGEITKGEEARVTELERVAPLLSNRLARLEGKASLPSA